MYSGKPPRQAALSIAYAIKKKNSGKYPSPKDENYADGGEVEEDQGHEAAPEPQQTKVFISPDSIVKSIHAKRMAAGGEVDDDFLSDEENTALPDESEPEELPDMKRKRMLSKAFEMVRQRQTRIQE